MRTSVHELERMTRGQTADTIGLALKVARMLLSTPEEKVYVF